MTTKRATDAELAAARRYEELRAEADGLKRECQQIAASVRAELSRRGVDALDVDDLKLRVVASTRTTYDYERAKARLSVGQLRRLSTPTITWAAVVKEIEAGRLKHEDVAAFAVDTTSEPYLRVL